MAALHHDEELHVGCHRKGKEGTRTAQFWAGSARFLMNGGGLHSGGD